MRDQGSALPAASIPPLKWAGGKRWFVARHLDLLPKRFNRYIEPFLGSGAVYFALSPRDAILSDVNDDLINVYRVIRSDPAGLQRAMKRHGASHSGDYYYRVRSARPRSDVSRAARTLYLNRTCWNGLYRVNKEGQFNVPIGSKSAVLLDSDNFAAISTLLKGAQIRCSDFEEILAEAREGDFAFVDPPYTVAHNHNGFVKYNQNLFSWDDQLRLRESIGNAVARGAYVVVTNAAHQSIHDLYSPYERINLSRAGVIAGDRHARGVFKEMVIRCFPD